MTVVVRHVPAPSQVRAGVNMVPVHVDATQVVPIACRRQPPLPLQNPSVPQLSAPWSAHWFSGSWPAGTAEQVPTVPVSAHERQVPAHAVAQHTPCSQNPALHSSAAPQAAPIGFLPQLMLAQVLGALQSDDVMHVVRHAPPVPHTYGSQVDGVAARQLPVPLHVRPGVYATPTQVGVAHVVPAA